MSCAYHVLLFSSYDPTITADIQYNGGWSIIAVTLFNMLVNFILMIIETIKEMKKKCKEVK